MEQFGYKVNVYKKTLRKALGLFSHYYITVPSLELEIHPGKYFYGTHHIMGKFKKNSTKCSEYFLCEDCITTLIQDANYLEHCWYYPIINCETLTRGLLSAPASISYQTLLVTGMLVSFAMAFKKKYMLLLTILFLIILIILNNFWFIYNKESCVHLHQKNKRIK